VSKARYRNSDRRVIPWLLLMLTLLLGALYVAAWYYAGDRVPGGTSVGGVHLGGERPARAERTLRAGLASRASQPIVVSAVGERGTLRPGTAGLHVDVRASVAAVTHRRSWDPRRMWEVLDGGSDRDAVVRVDRSALDRAVADFAARADEPAVEGGVGFSGGEPVAHYPRAGTVVDRARAADAVRRAFLRVGADDVVALPSHVVRPAVSKDEVSRAMDDFANPATSASVVVRLGRHDTRLQPADYTPALSMAAVGSRLEPRLDDAKLLRLLRPKMRHATRAPRDATVTVAHGRPVVVPARDGLTFRDEDVTTPFLGVLTHQDGDRLLTARGKAVTPARSTADARRLRIRERVSSFTTHFPYAAYRNVNIPRAAALVDGTILEPGQSFSLNATIGERTVANGFTKGYVISDGVFAKELGGGVSQMATTTFNAAYFAGMRDDAHKAHSFYISRYPAGREATVVWPDIDLRFTNTTKYGVLIRASVDKATPSRKGAVHVSMWSTRTWDIRSRASRRYHLVPPSTRHLHGAACVPNVGADGFDIDVDRLFYRPGSSTLDHRERMHTTYLPSDTVICS
jgi:vancomycin resistance protein YoaR